MSKVQVDKVVNLSDDGAPQLTYGAELPVGYGLTGAGGLNITGVVTAASAVFSGNVTIGGTLTYEDVTNIDVVGVSTFAGRMNVNSTINANEGLNVSAGVITAPSGFSGDLLIEDKIVHTGDTNTAIRFPAADTISFENAGSERLRIASDGDVIIGGSSDAGYADYADNLTIHDTQNSGITIRSGIASQGAVYFSDTTGTAAGTYVGNIIYDHSDNHMRFATSGSERVRITSAGLVGIGTASPDSLLHIFGATTGYAKIETGDGGTNPIVMHENPDRIWHTGLRGDTSDSYVIRDATASANRLVIDTSGNFGINETTPEAKLEVRSSDATYSLKITNDQNTSGSYNGLSIAGYDENTGSYPLIIVSNSITHETGGNTRFAVRADGNIGIGTAIPNIGSHSTALTIRNVNTSARAAIEIEGNTANCHAAIDFRNNGTLVSAINSRGTDRLQLCTGSSGNVKAEVTGDNFKIEDGDLVIGTAGHGIDFSANSNAGGMSSELFDHYEEGTWTPTIAYHYGSVTSYQTQVGTYTRIGRIVIAEFDVRLSDRGDGSGSYTYLTSLPYNHQGSRAGSGTVYYIDNLNTAVSSMSIELGGSSPTVAWFLVIAGTSDTETDYMAPSYTTNSFQVSGQLIYRVS